MELEGDKTSETTPPGAAADGAGSGHTVLGRRAFFERVVEIAAACVTVLLAIPFVRFLLYPVFVAGTENPWSNLGSASQFAHLAAPVSRLVTIRQRDGWLESHSQKPIYVTKDAQGNLEVLSAVCPHLGCTVQWSGPKHEFLCPCHGSVFAADGAHLAGPSPRAMDSLPIQVQNGQLLVRYEEFRQLLPVKELLD
ncbi:MAG: ubiquinol-cytochrome c reductase iron-sulfur subunit [Terriglobia bacterium]